MKQKNLHSLARTVKAGTILLEEGTAGGGMLILLAGRLGVYRDGSKVGEITEPGSYVGEASVITGADRMATVKAESSVTVVRLTSEQASAFLGTQAAGKKMVRNIADRLEAVNDRLIENQTRIDELKGAMTEVLTELRTTVATMEATSRPADLAEIRKSLRRLVNKYGGGRYTAKRINI